MNVTEFFTDTSEVQAVPPEVETAYSRYLILFSDPNSFGQYTDIEYIDSANSWQEIVDKFIDKMNEICPDHIKQHVPENIKLRGTCYRFVYDDPCGECDSLWCILPIP
jgi:hypothetical protein